MCAFIVMELLRITRQIHCKAVERRATLIHRQYNRDWGTSYSRPPIDPYLTSSLLQNPGGAAVCRFLVPFLFRNFLLSSALYFKAKSVQYCKLQNQNHKIQGGSKKRGHRLMTIILSNLNRFKKIHRKIPW